MSSSVRQRARKAGRASALGDDSSLLVWTVDDLRRLLGVGRAKAYEIARQLGRRIGGRRRGRLLVPRRALERWLEGDAS